MPDQEIDIEFKAAPAGQVAVNKKGIVECFVAGIGNKDSVGDICASGAFNASLKRRKPRVVWGHNWNDPIGKVLEIYEVPSSDPRLPEKMKRAGIGGLYAKVQFNLNSEKGKEAFANVQFFGMEQEWSIGYKTLDAIFDPAKQANVLKEVELYEVSPVLHGANQLTGTISIKGAKKPHKDPKGGLTAAGRAHYRRTEGSKLKPGVRGAADTPQKMRRKGSFLTRFFTNPSGPMKKPNGKPTRLALSAAAWGEPIPKNRSDAAKLAAKGRRLLERYENSKKKKDAEWDEWAETDGFYEFEAYFNEEFKALEDDYDVKEFDSDLLDIDVDIELEDEMDEKGHYMMRMIPARRPVPQRDIFAEGEAEPLSPEKRNALEMEIASRVQAPIKVMSATENLAIFAKKKPDGTKRFYRLPYHWDTEEREYMFGKPERVMPQMTFRRMKPTVRAPQVKPSQTTSRAYVGPKPEPTMAMVFDAYEKDEDDQEKSLEYMTDLSGFEDFEEKSEQPEVVIQCAIEDAFQVKTALDPLFEYHDVEVEVTEDGIKVLSDPSEEFLDAVAVASKSLFGGGSKKALRSLRRVNARFDPNAIDGDEDGLVQEGTPFERPATPQVGAKLREAVAGPQGGMQSSRRFDQISSPDEFKETVKERANAVQEKLDEIKEVYGAQYENLALMSRLENSPMLGSDLEELAWAVLGRDGKGFDESRSDDVSRLLSQYESFDEDQRELFDLESELDSLYSTVEQLRDEQENITDSIKRNEEMLDDQLEIINNGGKRLRMNRSEWEEITSASNRESAADKWLSDNHDPVDIQDEGYASDMREMLAAAEEVDDLRMRLNMDREDLEFVESRIGDQDTANRIVDDPLFELRDTDPFKNDTQQRLVEGVRKSLAEYRKASGDGRRGMRSTRNRNQITMNMRNRDVLKHSERLRDFADSFETDDERRVINAVADGLDPAFEGGLDRRDMQRVIDLLNADGDADESGGLFETAELLSNAKNGARNGIWTDANVDPKAQARNDFGQSSNVRIPPKGISVRLNDTEKGDIRRAIADEKNSLQGIEGLVEFDQWLRGSSDKMDADTAQRIVNGFNEYASRSERQPNPTLVAAKDVIDFAALDSNGTYESPNIGKDVGMGSKRPAVPGMTRRNMSDLLSWGQNESDSMTRDRYVGRDVNEVSPAGWAFLSGRREEAGMRSSRDDDNAPAAVRTMGVDTGKERQRGRPMGTVQEEARFKGKKWDEIKPDNWDEMTTEEQMDALYEFYSPSKSGLREVDFQRLSGQLAKKYFDEEKRRERRANRDRLRQEMRDRPTPEPAPQEPQQQATPEPEAPQADAPSPSAVSQSQTRDLKNLDRRISGNGTRISDAVNEGEASDDHKEFWDSLSDIAQEPEDITAANIAEMRQAVDEYLDRFRNDDLTAAESASVQAAMSLSSYIDGMEERYGDAGVDGGPRQLADVTGEEGMRSFRNYKPSSIAQSYLDARQSGGMRSARQEQELFDRAGIARTDLTETEANNITRIVDRLKNYMEDRALVGDEAEVESRPIDPDRPIANNRQEWLFGRRLTDVADSIQDGSVGTTEVEELLSFLNRLPSVPEEIDGDVLELQNLLFDLRKAPAGNPDGRGFRSGRAGRTQIRDEATYFKDVERSLPKEIREAQQSGDRSTADALRTLEQIMSRQQSGATGDRRTNVGTITVTQQEVDDIMDALMVVVDRQMETGGSRVVMFSKLIDMFAEAAMGTFVTSETEEIQSRTQTRTNSQGRTVQIPDN